MEDLSPAGVRARFRAGLRKPTAGCSGGFAQANLIIVPEQAAQDFERFARRNPRPCPLLDISPPGRPVTRTAPDADLRTDLPAYRIWVDGECIAEPGDVTEYWQPDLVAFLLGCSFTFERALQAAGVPVRHVDQGVNVPMYLTSRQCEPAGAFRGPLVTSMRPVPADLVETATTVTARYQSAHGAPVHAGDPAELGIADLARPDFGDQVAFEPGDVPVFWACGVTPQAALTQARLPFAITHSPGHMFVTDLPDSALVRPAPSESTGPGPGIIV